jgi:hypothetical protein
MTPCYITILEVLTMCISDTESRWLPTSLIREVDRKLSVSQTRRVSDKASPTSTRRIGDTRSWWLPDDTGSRRLPVSVIRRVPVGNLEAIYNIFERPNHALIGSIWGFGFRLRISPRIRSQNCKGLNAYRYVYYEPLPNRFIQKKRKFGLTLIILSSRIFRASDSRRNSATVPG